MVKRALMEHIGQWIRLLGEVGATEQVSSEDRGWQVSASDLGRVQVLLVTRSRV